MAEWSKALRSKPPPTSFSKMMFDYDFMTY